MGSECTCGEHFMDAEDYRDHLPCEGTPHEREIRILQTRCAALERALRELLKSGDRLFAYSSGDSLQIKNAQQEWSNLSSVSLSLLPAEARKDGE